MTNKFFDAHAHAAANEIASAVCADYELNFGDQIDSYLKAMLVTVARRVVRERTLALSKRHEFVASAAHDLCSDYELGILADTVHEARGDDPDAGIRGGTLPLLSLVVENGDRR
jgi:hypothetical protein